mmetsp:Transcript_20226/g.26180  ORF Transcript_20226/g.26180 Transcript_20226/m.26180 type:complete len:391 (+) Transcript_20226:2-1174(+)
MKKQRAEAMFKTALELHQEGEKLEEALRLYRGALAIGDEWLSVTAKEMVCTNLGALELNLRGDAAAAETWLTRASEINPTSASAAANECAFYSERDPDRGAKACLRALAIDPNHRGARIALESLAANIDGFLSTQSLTRQVEAALLQDDQSVNHYIPKRLDPITDIESRFELNALRFERLFTKKRPPYAWRLLGLLSATDRSRLLALGDAVGWENSRTTRKVNSTAQKWRLSETASLPRTHLLDTPAAQVAALDQAVFRRRSESPQLVRYPPGGFFSLHSDVLRTGLYRGREATLLFYLDNSKCPTEFPFASLADNAAFPRHDLANASSFPRPHDDAATLRVFPVAGDALLFINVDLENRTRPDALALHESRPCQQTKSIANVWFRLPDY